MQIFFHFIIRKGPRIFEGWGKQQDIFGVWGFWDFICLTCKWKNKKQVDLYKEEQDRDQSIYVLQRERLEEHSASISVLHIWHLKEITDMISSLMGVKSAAFHLPRIQI